MFLSEVLCLVLRLHSFYCCSTNIVSIVNIVVCINIYMLNVSVFAVKIVPFKNTIPPIRIKNLYYLGTLGSWFCLTGVSPAQGLKCSPCLWQHASCLGSWSWVFTWWVKTLSCSFLLNHRQTGECCCFWRWWRQVIEVCICQWSAFITTVVTFIFFLRIGSLPHPSLLISISISSAVLNIWLGMDAPV